MSTQDVTIFNNTSCTLDVKVSGHQSQNTKHFYTKKDSHSTKHSKSTEEAAKLGIHEIAQFEFTKKESESDEKADSKEETVSDEWQWSEFEQTGFATIKPGHTFTFGVEKKHGYIFISVKYKNKLVYDNVSTTKMYWALEEADDGYPQLVPYLNNLDLKNFQCKNSSSARNSITWVPVENYNKACEKGYDMVPGGVGSDGCTTYIGKIQCEDTVAVGKVFGGQIWYPYGGDEYVTDNGFEILMANKNCIKTGFKWKWVHECDEIDPEKAVHGGNGCNGELGFIGKCKIKNSYAIGKVYSKQGGWFPYGRKEHFKKAYQVLYFVD